MSFVDTNVLVYAAAADAPFRDRARAAPALSAARQGLAISRQVLREYVAVVTMCDIFASAPLGSMPA